MTNPPSPLLFLNGAPAEAVQAHGGECRARAGEETWHALLGGEAALLQCVIDASGPGLPEGCSLFTEALELHASSPGLQLEEKQ